MTLLDRWSLADRDRSWTRCADRLDAVEPAIAAFVAEPGRRERLSRDSRAVSQRWSAVAEKPTLYGIPVGVKDIVRVDGLPTGAGSALPAEVMAGPQAPLVDRLLAAGALVAGKTVTAEFAVSAPGPTRNPHNVEHTPGGSSSGSAAAVAAGMVPLAIGTQTIGSVVRPAAYCGVTGFKPSYGRIPVSGVIPNASSFDTVGVFAADVAGVAVLAGVLCDSWHPAAAVSPKADRPVDAGLPVDAGRPVIGIPSGPYLQRANRVALDAFAEHVGVLRAAGFTVRDIPVMPDFDAVAADSLVINRYEVARSHSRWFAEFGPLYRAETTQAIRQGQAVSENDYATSLAARERFRGEFLAEMPVDLWICPSATGPAPYSLDTTGDSVMCLPWSYIGLPSISLPAGSAGNGLPLGLQCVGRPGADEMLLSWALDIEALLGFVQ